MLNRHIRAIVAMPDFQQRMHRSRHRGRGQHAGGARRAAEVRHRQVGRRGQAGRARAALGASPIAGSRKRCLGNACRRRACACLHAATCRWSTIRATRRPTSSPCEQLIATHGRARRRAAPSSRRRALGRLQRLHHRGAARASAAAARHRHPAADGRPLRARSDEQRRRRRRAAAVHQHAAAARHHDASTTARFLRRLADLDWHVHPHVEGEHLPTMLPTPRSIRREDRDRSSRPARSADAASTAKVFKRHAARDRARAAPGSRFPAGYRLGPSRRRLCARAGAQSPAPIGWCGRATARSSATRSSSPIRTPSTG